MSFVSSDAVLIGVQSALVLVPGRPRWRASSVTVGLLVPGAALVVGVAIARASSGAVFLTDLAAIAAPLLAAAVGVTRCWHRPWLPVIPVAALYAVAWLWPGSLVGEGAAVAVIAGACLAVTGVVAGLAPPRWIAAGLVGLVVLDCVLVWGNPQVGPATVALQSAKPFALLGHALPSLQQAQFGSVQMGWLDLAAPALLGLVVERRLAAFVATAAAAGLWDLLFFVTSLIAATPPVLAGLVAGRPFKTPVREPKGRHNPPRR